MRQYRRAASELNGLPGLLGTFRGVRRRGNTWTGEQTLTCFVRRKLARSRIPRDEQIPRQLNGVPTDVLAIGRPRLHADVDASDLLVTSYGRARKSSISALVEHPNGGMVALGSGHGLLPIQHGAYLPGRWGAGENEVRVVDEDLSPGGLWFGQIGNDTDFAVARFLDLEPPTALMGHTLAAAPILLAPRRVAKHDIVQHVAARRGYRITGRIVAENISGKAFTLRSSDGIDVTYHDVIAVIGERVRFSLPGESGSLVFDEHRRALGFVVGGGVDPDDPEVAISFVLRDFTRLELGLDRLFRSFFTRSAQ